jgi:hypothetical protein
MLGMQQRVFAGEEMARVKDYYVRYSEVGKAVVVGDWSLSGKVVGASRTVELNMRNEEVFPLVGSYREGDEILYLVRVGSSEPPGVILSVDSSGSIVSEQFIAAPAKNIVAEGVDLYRMSDPPSDTRRLFRLEGEAMEVDRTAGYTNYSLIYQGTNGDQINIGYREFTPDDLARAAYYQDLVYKAGEPSIRFRGLLLHVKAATNEEIVFTVLQDDHIEAGPR